MTQNPTLPSSWSNSSPSILVAVRAESLAGTGGGKGLPCCGPEGRSDVDSRGLGGGSRDFDRDLTGLGGTFGGLTEEDVGAD